MLKQRIDMESDILLIQIGKLAAVLGIIILLIKEIGVYILKHNKNL